MKRYPKSNPEEPIRVERIHDVEMLEPLPMRTGDVIAVKLTLTRLKDDPQVVVWSCARLIEVEDEP